MKAVIDIKKTGKPLKKVCEKVSPFPIFKENCTKNKHSQFIVSLAVMLCLQLIIYTP